MTMDIDYWTNVIAENNASMKPIVDEMLLHPEKPLNREDFNLLRELLVREGVYSNYLSAAVRDERERSKKTWKFWKK